MFKLLLKLIFFVMGLIFAASLAVAALLLLAVWAVRVAWARLTGRPVTPWSQMFGQRFDPRAGFERFRAAAASRGRQPTAADVAGARARGGSVASPARKLDRDADVTDVHVRQAMGPGR